MPATAVRRTRSRPDVNYSVNEIIAAAELLGWSPLKLCHESKTRHSVVNRWRTGETAPTLRTLDRMWKVLEENGMTREKMFRTLKRRGIEL